MQRLGAAVQRLGPAVQGLGPAMQRLGPAAQRLGPAVPGSRPADPGPNDTFRRQFVRLKKEHKLYLQTTNGVTLLTPTVFRTDMALPAEAAIGNYDVDVRVFADRQMVARTGSAFEIIKVCFEQFVANAARDYGLLYGLATALMAWLTGWFASVVFRKD